MLNRVQYAPVIFQDYIDAKADIRITIVGEEIFAAAIYSQETSYKVDFRMDMGNARVEEIQLPQSVSDKLLKLMNRLGLMYGAIDMRQTSDDRYVFLEINPAGQWLFIENRTRQPISDRVARLLIEKH
jgi:Glutathione synthase/Ribosomal protein S6 modification enzyme (glutaminyl transferase)